jgi:hypothetical protein
MQDQDKQRFDEAEEVSMDGAAQGGEIKLDSLDEVSPSAPAPSDGGDAPIIIQGGN